MRKIYYYIPITLIACLLMGFSANAANSFVSASGTDANGNTISVRANAYTSIPYDEQEEIINSSNATEYVFKWHLTQNPQIQNVTQGHYYTGYLSFRINFGPSTAILTQGSVTLQNSYLADGLRMYIEALGNGFINVGVIFDNYYASDNWIGLGTISYEYYVSRTSFSNNQLTPNFSTTLTISPGALYHSDSPYNNGFAGVLSHMIGYSISSAQEFDDIITMLSTIRSSDAAFYVSLTNQLTNLLTAQNLTNTNLTSILNELDLDFAAVQTILDLFPSYRTAVLQYWQQLLEMNAQQSSEAAEMESQYQDKDQQSGDLLSGLGSLTLPSVSSGDFNILANTDDTAKTNFFGLIGTITNNTFITNMLLIIITAAIVGYALYGKK